MPKNFVKRAAGVVSGTSLLFSGSCLQPSPEWARPEPIVITTAPDMASRTPQEPTAESIPADVREQLTVERQKVSTFLAQAVVPYLPILVEKLAHADLPIKDYDRSEQRIGNQTWGDISLATSDGLTMTADYGLTDGNLDDMAIRWFRPAEGKHAQVMLGQGILYDAKLVEGEAYEPSLSSQIGTVCYQNSGWQYQIRPTEPGTPTCYHQMTSPLGALKGMLLMLNKLEAETGLQ
jgi:hypothetical protein